PGVGVERGGQAGEGTGGGDVEVDADAAGNGAGDDAGTRVVGRAALVGRVEEELTVLERPDQDVWRQAARAVQRVLEREVGAGTDKLVRAQRAAAGGRDTQEAERGRGADVGGDQRQVAGQVDVVEEELRGLGALRRAVAHVVAQVGDGAVVAAQGGDVQ